MVARAPTASTRRGSRGPSASGVWWAPRRASWWIGVLFAIGSTCFLVGPFPGFEQLVGSGADGMVFFVGSIFFTSAAALQWLETINADPGPALRRGSAARAHVRAAPHRLVEQRRPARRHRLLQLHAPSTRCRHGLDAGAYDRLVWTPDALGSVCFLVVGLPGLRRGLRPRALAARSHARVEDRRGQPRRLHRVRHLGDRLVLGASTRAACSPWPPRTGSRRSAGSASSSARCSCCRSPPPPRPWSPAERRCTLTRDVRSDRRSRARRARAGLQAPPRRPDRVLDRRARPAADRAEPAGRERAGLAERALGLGQGDLGRLHRPRLHLPGPADRADRARLVRDPALRLSGRRDVHARARGLRRGRGAEQLPPGEHRHVRDAAHVRRDRAGSELPGRARRLRRPEDLLPDHRDADLRLPVPRHRRLVRLPVREREGRDREPRRARRSGSSSARSS